ncbi:MAG: hypothetical protein ACKO24_00525 [Leptolyngbyaceae cyanobacterium]
MSESMFKKLPDALSQISWPQVQQTLSQPFTLALLASLGIHGLLAVTLPLWSAARDSESADDAKSVEVVTLNPLEQMRLPENQTTPWGATPLPAPSNPAFLQPLKPEAKATGKATSPLWAAPPLLNDPSLYNIPVLPPPPVTVLPPLGLPPLPKLDLPDTSPRRPVSTAASPAKLAEVLAKLSKPPAVPTASPTPATSPSVVPSPTATEEARPQTIPAAAIAALRERREQLRQQQNNGLYSFNKANTTEGEFNQNITQLTETAKEIAQDNIDSEWNRQKEITDLYPRDACPSKAKGVTWIGAIFNPEGKLEKKPALLLSSGYAGLDQAALQYVEQQSFKSSEKYQAVIFPFKFEYSESVCAAEPPASPPSSGPG